MTKKLARLLRADIQETSDLKSIAKMLANKGRGNDTLLAHITPREVKILKAAGGSGTVNPDTGLMEFDDSFDVQGFEAPAYQIPKEYSSGADYAATQPAQVGTQDSYYQPSTPVELTAPESSAPAAPTTVFDQNQALVNQVGNIQPADYNLPQVQGTSLAAGVPAVDYSVAAGRPAPTGLRLPSYTTPEETPTPSALQKYVIDPYKALKDATGLTGTDLLRVGGAGTGAVLGRQQAKKAAEQIQQATQEQKNLGQPYQQTGQELQRAAMSGELTPQGAQSLQAARAQLNQGIESRGGVGVAQAQAQIETLRQNLLQNQYNLGLQVSQIGDNIALGAIRTGMQLDQQLTQANMAFYTQLGALAAGVPTYRSPT